MPRGQQPLFEIGQWIKYHRRDASGTLMRGRKSISQIKDSTYSYHAREWIYKLSNGDEAQESDIIGLDDK